MTPDDRRIVEDILKEVRDNAKITQDNASVTRGLSVSLIGKANGQLYDESGGRIGRLERAVVNLEAWRWWMMCSIVTLLLSGMGYIIKNYLEHHP